ncbi:MAG: hypothetical protein Kow0092_11300 [Deferrisomatales bacterium]
MAWLRRNEAAPTCAGQGRRPPHPYWVLTAALVLPGAGQVMNRMPTRGLTMLFFMISLAWVTYHLTTPQHSFAGRHAGGLFVYAMSILDAYKWARYRWEYFRVHGRLPGAGAS